MNTAIKLRYIDTTYKVIPEEKMVVAFSKFQMNILDFHKEIIRTKGIAKAVYDEFDEITGKRLARAKAEKEAYIQFRDYIQERLDSLRNFVKVYTDALDKTKRNIINQKEYIRKY